MRILIDARMLFGNIHGIARYLLEMLKVWQRRGVDHKFTLITNNPKVPEDLGLLSFCDCISMKSKPFQPAEIFELPTVVKKAGGDLFHAPSISVPAFRVMPTVITVHDLIPLHFGGRVHRVYCNTVLKGALKYADSVIAVSDYTKEDVIKSLGCDAGKIFVTHEAAMPRPDDTVPLETLGEKYGIEKPYLFTLTNPKPHKNLTGLIKIYDRIREGCGERVQLVVGSKTSEAVEKALSESPFKKDVIRINYLEDEELDTLYSEAEAFLFASYFEGFGLPPLEAMKRGCPVISSDRTSLRGVVGEGGILCDPDDHETFAKSVISLLEDPEKRKEWSEKALMWEKGFSWEKCAMETLEIFEKAVKSS